MMFCFGQVIAFAAYLVAVLGAIYWTFFVFTDFWGPVLVKNAQGFHHTLDVKPGVASLEVYVPSGQKSDNYQNVDIVIDGQTVSLMLDTSFADLFVASSECDSDGPESPCYNIKQPYHITEETVTFEKDIFHTTLYTGSITGNVSYPDVGLGSLVANNIATAFIYDAHPNYFRNGTFAGVLGIGLRRSSIQWRQDKHLPVIDASIIQSIFKRPIMSLSSPRYGDPDQKTGTLTLGAIEKYASINISYTDVVPFSRTPDKPNGLANLLTAGWTFELTSIRMNGITVPISPGRLRPDGKHVAVIDTGAPSIFLRAHDFHALQPLFWGHSKVEVQENGESYLWIQCDLSNLLELKFRETWFPIDPLDLIEVRRIRIIDGDEMCLSTLRPYESTLFGDSLMGLPFLRSVLAVFDYVSEDMYSVPPRLGLASIVDKEKALKRYGELRRSRMLEPQGGFGNLAFESME